MFASPIPDLKAELFWLAATVLMTSLFWVPYVLNRLAEHGLWGALRNPDPDAAPQAPWARRMMAAHANAVENLVLFAPLVGVVVLAGKTSDVTAAASAIYFFARLAHFVVYSAGVPVARTLAFATGLGACVALALAAFGVI